MDKNMIITQASIFIYEYIPIYLPSLGVLKIEHQYMGFLLLLEFYPDHLLNMVAQKQLIS
jgi:hypothetical protein